VTKEEQERARSARAIYRTVTTIVDVAPLCAEAATTVATPALKPVIRPVDPSSATTFPSLG
jgi:hypothetical protein